MLIIRCSLVLDEAHKVSPQLIPDVILLIRDQYLTENTSSSRLTESLLSVIRQQRHLATRVVISTQEPTVVPSKFLDLCSFIIAHRFSSPTWLNHLVKHVAAGATISDDWFEKVIYYLNLQRPRQLTRSVQPDSVSEDRRSDAICTIGAERTRSVELQR